MDMQRGPPRPRESSADGMTRQLMPFLYSTSLVTLLRWYTTTVPGRTQSVLEPSFHCSRSAAMRSPPPQGMSFTGWPTYSESTFSRSSLRSRIFVPPLPSGVISNTVSGPMMPGWMVNLS